MTNPLLKVDQILGLTVTAGTLHEVVEVICSWLSHKDGPRYFVCMNPHSFECARRDSRFMAAASEASLLVPDGIGVVMASRLRGGAIRQRVCGPEIFLAVTKRLNDQGGKSVFFLGGKPDTLDRVIERHQREFPRIRIAGSFAPPYSEEFSEADTAAIAKAINDTHADVLWVGLGSPKQERWTHEARTRLNVKMIGPIGAMFDFYAGTIPMAPAWIRAAGLQWLYRLVQEPRRLWRRNLDGPVFAIRALLERRGTTNEGTQTI